MNCIHIFFIFIISRVEILLQIINRIINLINYKVTVFKK